MVLALGSSAAGREPQDQDHPCGDTPGILTGVDS